MDNDSRPFEHADSGAGGPASAPVQASGDAAADSLADIGYESADPWLHAPLWREAMQACPARRDWR